ncbi:differentially expressed in FDCP 8-like [Amphiura filiformis]|uniref:differentially expressed in FDCP 8-like n=1 Tax=Amphiura filiformis TaxID=82378 RepID=UPI003B2289F2
MDDNGMAENNGASNEFSVKTIETSAAVIKFNTGNMSPASTSSSDDEDEDRTAQSPAANGQTSPGWLPEEDRGGRHWTEESWRSDSGFNSDNAAFVAAGGTAQRDDTCRPSTLPIDRLTLEDNLPDDSKESTHEDGEAITNTNGVGGDTNCKLPSDDGMTEDERDEMMLKSDRFNPFNKVPFIEEEHFVSPTISNTPRYNFHEAAMDAKKLEPGKPRRDSHSTSSDTDTDISLPSKDQDFAEITNEDLGIAEDHFSQPEGFFGYSKVDELEFAIENCKDLVKSTTEHSDQRRELVTKLVQLRMKLMELKEGPEENPDVKTVLGHRFRRRKGKSSNHQCETCNSVIWGMLQSWHRCAECGFNSHSKCLNFVKRQCVSSQLSSMNYLMEICPETGLGPQNYRCAECRTTLSFRGDLPEPRQCDYTGQYYCTQCHWNDSEVIPARVVHNWDFEPRKVCRHSNQLLKLMSKRAVLRIQDLNPTLFNYVEELSQIKKLREEVLIMKMYFLSCRTAMENRLLTQLQNRPHFVENSDVYSMQDLIDTKDGVLLPSLSGVHGNFAVHIRMECQLCQARGFICELCNTDEVLYPFDIIAAVCSQCSAVFHRDCFYKKDGECPRCLRLTKRSAELSISGGDSRS